MTHESLQIIRDEHAAVAAMLRSLILMVERGPHDDQQQYFDVLRAMLFYIDEFPERLHHPKETELLFPKVAEAVPATRDVIAQLDREHQRSEVAVRELQHKLLAWELLGETRRPTFEHAVRRYVELYLEHMHLEESEILPKAEQCLSAQQWDELDAAFATNCDPMTGKYPRDPLYNRLFTRIVSTAAAPIGLAAAH